MFYKRKVYYTLGSSVTVSGCFIVKALTRRRLFLKICAKQYDLEQENKQHVYITNVEVR